MKEQEVGGGEPFGGDTYDPEADKDRLLRQLAAVKNYMLSAKRWTMLSELSEAVDAPMQSVSARLRDLRKAKFGSYVVLKRNLGGGLWEYVVLKPSEIQWVLDRRVSSD